MAVADGEGPLPHDPWFRVLTRHPLTYAHELPYKVRGEASTRIHTSGSWPVNERISLCLRHMYAHQVLPSLAPCQPTAYMDRPMS